MNDAKPTFNFLNKIIIPRIEAAGDVMYGFLITMSGNDNTKSVRSLRNSLEQDGLSYFNSDMKMREAYRKASHGLTVQLLTGADADPHACAEVKSITNELVQHLKTIERY